MSSIKKIDEKVLKFIRQNNLISKNDKLIIALSGGPDSVFSLKFLLKYKQMFNVSPIAVHINHNLRGLESYKDEKFCVDFCYENGVQLIIENVDVKSFAQSNGLSTEEAARELRYNKLYEVANNINAEKIVVAHNANDNTETVLLNFFKGTGLSGLSGIPVLRDRIIRPFLILTREEILYYLNSENIQYRIDSSNENINFERNFIRHKVVPIIKEKINPKLDNAIFRNSRIVNDFYASFKQFLIDLDSKFISVENEIVKIDLSITKEIGQGTIGELFKYLFEKYFNKTINFAETEKIIKLIKKQKGAKEQLTDSLFVFKDTNSLLFYHTLPSNSYNKSTTLNVGETVEIENKKISISEIEKQNVKLGKDKGNEFISGDKVIGSFIVRKWEDGDKFIPLGMRNFKKLSDFLTDEKISHLDKNNQLVLINNKNIVWVVGRRIDERYKILSTTKKIYKLCLN